MKKKTNPKITGEVKKRSWDDLANDIISLETLITKEKKRKSLILLKNKLKELEKEKSSRIFDTFNMKTFLNKNIKEFEE